MALSSPPVRPIGFPPAETSALQNDAVVSQHAEEAAFLWTMRNGATGEPHYSLLDLAKLDERVEAHLEGLRLATDSWRYCKENLERGNGPGELFAMAVLAFGAGHRDRMLEVVQAGNPVKLRAGLESALGWLDFASVSTWIRMLSQSKSPEHRVLGIAACSIQRQDPGVVLAPAAEDANPTVRARALRAIGEIKRSDLLTTVLTHLQDEDEGCRFWAAWSATLLQRPEGRRVLAGFVERNDPYSDRALQLCARAMALSESRSLISSLTTDQRYARLIVVGTGVVGDPISIPWLIRKMENPESARLAGEAFTMITGVDLERQSLDQDAPPAREEQTDDGAETETPRFALENNLPWPSAARVTEWWDQNGSAFTPGVRYLAGKPIDKTSATEVLFAGKQRQRAAAAYELALMDEDRVLFNVRGRAPWQKDELARWT